MPSMIKWRALSGVICDGKSYAGGEQSSKLNLAPARQLIRGLGVGVINLSLTCDLEAKDQMGEAPGLGQDLNEIVVLLCKYRHYGQMRAVEEIRGT